MRDLLLFVIALQVVVFVVIDTTIVERRLTDIDKNLTALAANTRSPIQLQIVGFSPEAQKAMDTALQPQRRKTK